MAINTWMCQCGHENTIRERRCPLCGAHASGWFINKVFEEEYELAGAELRVVRAKQQIPRVRKERDILIGSRTPARIILLILLAVTIVLSFVYGEVSKVGMSEKLVHIVTQHWVEANISSIAELAGGFKKAFISNLGSIKLGSIDVIYGNVIRIIDNIKNTIAFFRK